jgi:hypothetical protein
MKKFCLFLLVFSSIFIMFSTSDNPNKALSGAMAQAKVELKRIDKSPTEEDRYGPIVLVGTKEQRAFAHYVLGQIKFPFDKLKITTAKIQFKEGIMNGGNYGVTDMLGVATIDASLVGNMTTGVHNIMCEVSHIVDSGWMTDSMRKAIVALVAKGDSRVTWFPDYNKLNDYSNLISECFHQIFITSYTDYPNPNRLNFWITSQQAPAIRKIIGLERTDAAKPH